MNIKLQFLQILLLSGLLAAQQPAPHDTLQKKKLQSGSKAPSGLYRISVSEYSRNGRWLAIRKLRDENSDTVMVLDTQSRKTVASFVRKSSLSFVGPDGLLAAGTGNAEFVNLATGKKKLFGHVTKAETLALDRYAVLDVQNILSVYGPNGVTMQRVLNVHDFYVAGSRKRLFVQVRGVNKYEVWDCSSSAPKILYSTTNPIRQVKASPSGKLLSITESRTEDDGVHLTLVETGSGNAAKLKDIVLAEGEELHTDELQDGKAYLITAVRNRKAPDSETVEIWHGEDGNLQAKTVGTRTKRYWLWKPGTDAAVALPTDRYPEVAAFNNTRYVLVTKQDENYNYRTFLPRMKAALYDTEISGYLEIPETQWVFSQDGRFLLGKEEGGAAWNITDLRTLTKTTISGAGLKNPVFSEDVTRIYFESMDDLWGYDIKKERLVPLGISGSHKAVIVNFRRAILNYSAGVYTAVFDPGKPLLVQVSDEDTGNVTLISFHKGKKGSLFDGGTNRIRGVNSDERVNKIILISENYNSPAEVVMIDAMRNIKQVLYKSNPADTKAAEIRQEVIHFANSKGRHLKGMLYYPEDFDPAKKYPMVVRIYQIQSGDANEYRIPGLGNPVGFDLRTLIGKGYFVYLPDIFFDERGPGVAAVDCVNSALDAVDHLTGIDKGRVGLMGHSMGGYLTNFIAGRSNRFAAYISGAGHSDIVRAYFSFSYNYDSPLYWQFESGQYEMKAPFSEDKELYTANNPILEVENVNAPMLLWTGKKDMNVYWDHTMEFYIGLKRNGKRTVALFYPGQGHDLGRRTPERKDLNERVLDWFDHFLKKQPAKNWINTKDESVS